MGKKTGKGKIVQSDTEYYDGEVVDGVPNGKGIQIRNDEVQEGYFANGSLEGEGKITINSDFVFQGTFTKGLLEGKGEMHSIKTQRSYQGMYLNGKEHGKGVSISIEGEKYEGDFADGKRHGLGIFTE